MAKKRARPASTDADRRARQCQRLARMLQALQCIMGPGKWDAEALSQELGCSVRTVHRILQTLAMAGIPYRYDPESRAYRVPHGYRFPGMPVARRDKREDGSPAALLPAARRLAAEMETFTKALNQFCLSLDEQISQSNKLPTID